jgi:hypothetical protein
VELKLCHDGAKVCRLMLLRVSGPGKTRLASLV